MSSLVYIVPQSLSPRCKCATGSKAVEDPLAPPFGVGFGGGQSSMKQYVLMTCRAQGTGSPIELPWEGASGALEVCL